ncbi:MAG: hypothetical protein R6V78_01115 [Desulfosarcina sp.]
MIETGVGLDVGAVFLGGVDLGAGFLVGAALFAAAFFVVSTADAAFFGALFLEVDLIRLFFPMKNPFEFEFGLAYNKME